MTWVVPACALVPAIAAVLLVALPASAQTTEQATPPTAGPAGGVASADDAAVETQPSQPRQANPQDGRESAGQAASQGGDAIRDEGRANRRAPAPPSDDAQQLSSAERAALVKAATAEAADRLLRQVEQQRLTPELTVGELLDRMPPEARETLRRQLRGAPQVGGPRFANARSAQVQLSLRGRDAATWVRQAIAQHGEAAGVDRADLARRLEAWNDRTFGASGGSIAPQLVNGLRPRGLDRAGWANVPDEVKTEAWNAAHAHAVNRLIEAARDLRLTEVPRQSTDQDEQGDDPGPPADAVQHVTLGDVFATGSVEAETRAWLAAQPITRLSYDDDGRRVEVKLAIEPAEWTRQLRSAMAKLEAGLPAVSEEQWSRVTAELAEKVPGAAVGEHTIDPAAIRPQAAPDLVLPRTPPAWARRPIAAEGIASPPEGAAGSRAMLLAREAAAGLAREDLRTQLDALPVTDEATLGALAREHARVRALLDAAVTNAPIAGAEYKPDGQVRVRVSLSGEAIWRKLTADVRTH